MPDALEQLRRVLAFWKIFWLLHEVIIGTVVSEQRMFFRKEDGSVAIATSMPRNNTVSIMRSDDMGTASRPRAMNNGEHIAFGRCRGK